MSSSGEKRMTKRSDFAQKLLDDLRVRKEQLSISQKSLPTDYAYSNRSYKGSKEIRAKNITFQDFNYGETKSLTSGFEASNQILPYGKSRNIDLSKALAYALENAGKATRNDPSGNASIISFLHEVGKRSLGFGNEERRRRSQSLVQQPSSSNQPMIHVHIKEISKGTQKLNQIIKACSNGLGFRKGRYTIQCGEDLELERSLRLLVDIQQASEYTTTKQRRNRIKLLEENDDEEEEEEETPNRKYTKIKEVTKADIEMRLLALNYREDKNKNHRKQMSSGEDTEQRSLKPQKGRIPNVVAKLMGLGEFPEDDKETMNKNKNDASNFLEMKVHRRSKSLDLVIHKETQTANGVNHKAKSQQKDGSNIKKRNKVSNKKDGGIMKKNVIRRNSSPSAEDKRKIVARSQQKALHKLSIEKKLILHNLEGSEEKKSIEKEKFPRERPKTNGVMTNHSLNSSSLVDIQTKQPLTGKAKTLRNSFSQVEVTQKEVEREVRKAEILEKKNQEISNPNGRLWKVVKLPQNQKPDSKAETCISSSEVPGVEVKSSLNRNELEHKREIKDDSILLIAAERVPCQAQPENKHHGMDEQASLSKSDETSNRLSKTEYKGTKEEVKEDISLSEKRLKHRKTEKLSENEINLKKIVSKSQLFLDTAEALFKLKIPLNILHDADVSDYNQVDKNLILDCGYELMKRKGRFQELSVHPFVKAPISSSKVSSLDQLVRQLSKEFEKLRAYGKDCYTGSSLVEEDYTPKVLERDVYHKDPNLNSMWDMGWNDSMFAFIEKDDVVRDIEREVFSGLMDEITRDLICI